MVSARWKDFSTASSIDFEYATVSGTGRPIPHTFVALDVGTGRQIRLAGPALRAARRAPFDVRSSLTLAYNFQAESQCFEALNWEQPWWPLDPYAEHIALTNGLSARDVFEEEEEERRIGYRLIDALRFYGRPVDLAAESHKREMQLLGARGEPYTPAEWAGLLDYCADDTTRLAELFAAMKDDIDLPAALVRGRSMIAMGQQSHRGIPVDDAAVDRFKGGRTELRGRFIDRAPLYPGGRFSSACLVEWADQEGIGLPRYPDGRAILEQGTLKRVARLEPRLAPLAALRSVLSKLEDFRMTVRSDGRVRPNYWPFGTRTGRNKPKASQFPMLQAAWLRGFILAPPGRRLAQLDYKAQEVYIAAALSDDRRLLDDLEADLYLGLAIRSGLAPAGATKRTHAAVRDRFKPALLGIIYGMGERTLASQLGVDVATAREVREQFRRRYRRLWDWLEGVVFTAYATRSLETPLGWPLVVGPKLTSYTLRNHLIQAAGGDILRSACLLAQDAGLGTIATLHDSILLEADADRIEAQVAELSRAMTLAAAHVIDIPIPVEVDFTGRRYRLKGEAAAFFKEVIRQLAAITRAGQEGHPQETTARE
jgi:hypothetical protein